MFGQSLGVSIVVLPKSTVSPRQDMHLIVRRGLWALQNFRKGSFRLLDSEASSLRENTISVVLPPLMILVTNIVCRY